tara:strand:+ start:50 stop:229 length:180 start_codon:yes stop_codon:yes gene_type:complete
MNTFNDLSIGAVFKFNGSVWEKKSTRTAWLLERRHSSSEALSICGTWFYFGKAERINNY